jgi:methyl-accepting chemotaxis protein
MFKSMSIPRKLAFSFIAINASAAVMMIVFFVNIAMIRSSTNQNNLSQDILARELLLETSLLRQNSQMRGFLVTGDQTYLKSYFEGRDDYDKTSAELETLLADPERIALLKTAREETVKWRQDWGDRLIDVVKAGARDGAEQQVRDAGKKVLVSDAVLPLRDLRDRETKIIESNSARQKTAIFTAMIALVVGGIALIGIAVMLSRNLSKSIARPITALTRRMADLASGKNNITVPDVDRTDELGDMARAVLIFRDAAVAKANADAVQSHVVEALGKGLEALADGDMTFKISEPFAGDYDGLRMRPSTARSRAWSAASPASPLDPRRACTSVPSEIRAASEDLGAPDRAAGRFDRGNDVTATGSGDRHGG